MRSGMIKLCVTGAIGDLPDSTMVGACHSQTQGFTVGGPIVSRLWYVTECAERSAL